MSKRISLKLTDKNDWLVEAIENFNNTIEKYKPALNRQYFIQVYVL